MTRHQEEWEVIVARILERERLESERIEERNAAAVQVCEALLSAHKSGSWVNYYAALKRYEAVRDV